MKRHHSDKRSLVTLITTATSAAAERHLAADWSPPYEHLLTVSDSHELCDVCRDVTSQCHVTSSQALHHLLTDLQVMIQLMGGLGPA